MVSELADIICDNSQRLGGWTGKVETWPDAPATGISLHRGGTMNGEGCNDDRLPSSDTISETNMISEAISNTEAWVDETLCKLGLCPYTASMRRAAVGLGPVGVKEGPVVVRHALSSSAVDGDSRVIASDAISLVSSFWRGVEDLATSPEEKVATFLIVAPPYYDTEFTEFIATCDGLLERTAKAVGADDVIGKAWFHPNYDSSLVGQDQILPGHALPATMVQRFVEEYYGDPDAARTHPPVSLGDADAIARANDAVRHTPHATVNLLRRSQLQASKKAEAALTGTKVKPNFIYARNVVPLMAPSPKE